PVDPEHDDQYPEQEKDVLEQVDQDAGEHLIEVVRVVGDAGHQPPYGIAVEKLHRQPLQVGEDLLADAVDDALAGVVQDIDLTVPEEKRADDDGHINPGEPGDGVEVRMAQKQDLVRNESHRV